ncbi:activating transcription factor 7-interacting protein 1-like [Sipha flava]|uniref:Activating transcription factor 7-interacting protein 1 n=1 Tax=Sipha flava TaxID=143950 RepID=A0A2S2QYG1_9HEMI|nr:activating transcription factor 7-interacting protein 1-like [Sipha flava]XP_025404740.1 activating transcription factor 7-interacting protein 1-like [Sipha flava]
MTSNLVQKSVCVGQKLKPVQVGSILKSVQIQSSPINPVMKSVKRGVAITTRQISTSNSDGTLKPVLPAIPIPKHPAQLPAPPLSKYVHTPKKIPPAPRMTINVSVNTNAIVLSWNVDLNNTHAEISNYQIFTYKESPTDIPRSAFWKEIGKVDALPLPMICSLNNIIAGGKYHFAIKAVDVHCCVGPFSVPISVYFTF